MAIKPKVYINPKFLISLWVILTTLFLANAANACTCMDPPNVEMGLDEAKNVAIFKVQSVEKFAEGEKGYGYDGFKQARLTVEKVFKGNLKVGQELVFKQGGGGDCIITYDEKSVGAELLYFLGDKPAKDKLWEARICTRSNGVPYAAADLLYLEKLAKVRGRSRLSGTLTQEIESSIEEVKPSYNRLAGRRILISGNGKNIELKTDKNGVYEIYDLPPGKYKLTPEKLFGFKFSEKNESSVEVEISYEDDLEEEDFEYTIDNSIRGRLFDPNGKPLKNVGLDLIPTGGTKIKDFAESDSTNEDGVFLFDKIPPGSYLIVVNEDGKVTADEPFGTFYYPGTTKRENAAEINIEAGDVFKDLIINAPQTAETITITGVLLFDDGKPVVNERVEFYNSIEDVSQIEKNKYPDSFEKTNEKGQFSIRILKGQKGILFGSLYIGDFENCPKMVQLAKAKGEDIHDLETPSIQIDAVSDISETELKFLFPSCKKFERK